MKLSDEDKQSILDSCLSDSSKVISYLDKQNKKQTKYNILTIILSIFAVIFAGISSIPVIIEFITNLKK